jgi:ElaB/YqjD/DUF883 family membrane-anchored ribosome-binding protein
MKTKSRNHVGAQDLMEDINTLASDAKAIFDNNVTEPASDALAALRDRLDSAKSRLGEYYDTAKERTIAGARATDTVIRDKPYHAIAVAAAAGVLLGLFIARDRD